MKASTKFWIGLGCIPLLILFIKVPQLFVAFLIVYFIYFSIAYFYLKEKFEEALKEQKKHEESFNRSWTHTRDRSKDLKIYAALIYICPIYWVHKFILYINNKIDSKFN